MDGIFRRKSVVYFGRISVPKRLRERLGRTELIASLNVRELQLAQIAGAPVVAGWRRMLREIEGRFPVDVLQVSVGSALLASSALMPLQVAASASGLERDELLSLAASGELAIYLVPGHRPGFLVPLSALDRDRETGGYDVPPPKLMPPTAQATQSPGPLIVRREELRTSNLLCLLPKRPRHSSLPCEDFWRRVHPRARAEKRSDYSLFFAAEGSPDQLCVTASSWRRRAQVRSWPR